MKILLPPSETKVSGGAAGPLNLAGLAAFSLTGSARSALLRQRSQLVDAVVTLAAKPDECRRALRLGATQHAEIERNRQLRRSATMPAIARYTGVLFDAIGLSSLDTAETAYLHRHVVIQSALFGAILAGDHIPAYRLSHNSQVFGPGKTLASWWAQTPHPLTPAEPNDSELLLDLRSKAYRALGPLPASTPHIVLEFLSRGSDGTLRPLSHFNKQAKGHLVRELANRRLLATDPEQLLAALSELGYAVRRTGEHSAQLFRQD